MTQTEALNQHLAKDLERYADMLENGELVSPDEMNCASVMRLAAEALAKPEQESVAMADYMAIVEKYAFLKASQRTWVGLTDEETETLVHRFDGDPHTLLDEVNARLKEKNT